MEGPIIVYITIQVNKHVWAGGSGTGLIWLRIWTVGRAVVNAVMDLRVPYDVGNFLTG